MPRSSPASNASGATSPMLAGSARSRRRAHQPGHPHFIDRVLGNPRLRRLGDRDIDGIALDQLRLFDESLLLGVDERDRRSIASRRTCRRSATAPAADDAARTIESQLVRFNTRQEVIEGRATSRDGVLAALRPIAEVIPRCLLRTAGRRDLDPG